MRESEAISNAEDGGAWLEITQMAESFYQTIKKESENNKKIDSKNN